MPSVLTTYSSTTILATVPTLSNGLMLNQSNFILLICSDPDYSQFNVEHFLVSSDTQSSTPNTLKKLSIRVPKYSNKATIDTERLPKDISKIKVISEIEHPTEVSKTRAKPTD